MSQVNRNRRDTYRALLTMAIRSLLAFLFTRSAATGKQSMAEQYNQAPNELGAEDGFASMSLPNGDHPIYPQTPGDEAMADLSAQMNDVEMGNDEVHSGSQGGLVRYYASDGEDSDGGEPDRDSDSDYPSETDENGDPIEDDEGSDEESTDSEASDSGESGKDLSDEEMIEMDRSNVIGHGNRSVRDDNKWSDEEESLEDLSYEEVIGMNRSNVISYGHGSIRDRLEVDYNDPATIEFLRSYMMRYGPGSNIEGIEVDAEKGAEGQSDEDGMDVNVHPSGSSDGPRQDCAIFHDPLMQMHFGHRVETTTQPGIYDMEEALQRFLQWASAYNIQVLRERIQNVTACVERPGSWN